MLTATNACRKMDVEFFPERELSTQTDFMGRFRPRRTKTAHYLQLLQKLVPTEPAYTRHSRAKSGSCPRSLQGTDLQDRAFIVLHVSEARIGRAEGIIAL